MAICEESSDVCPVREGQIHVVITREGIVAKRISRIYGANGSLAKFKLESDNSIDYYPLIIDKEEILKIYVVRGIDTRHACSEI